MSDQSHLDNRYFVDAHVYNCPFCNRRHVSYGVFDSCTFDWTTEKKCQVFFVRCDSCKRDSMHLTFRPLRIQHTGYYSGKEPRYTFYLPEGAKAGQVLDESFFYSVPTSFFALDQRVPRVLRELLTEAEGCLKTNFLTGASACARKIVYELARIEKGEGDDYEARIKSLKKVHPEVEPTYFDTLLTVGCNETLSDLT